MIAAVRGALDGKTLDSALVNVGGVTLRVYAPLTTLAKLNVGETVALATFLLVREDVMALYGFATPEDRDMFEQLLSVGGVGPRVGLALLSALNSSQLYEAVLAEDVTRLTMAPGVGKKLAARLVLELRPRFEKLSPVGAGIGGVSGIVAPGNVRAQVIEALTGLGYSTQQAAAAVRTLPEDAGGNIEDLIMRALRSLASE
ncbi:MAG TPA: Holliday junction branch migration protein RuvA [Ktedonobacterales bacterium]|nr:Holliday junction branch migration protein RuvA [Ktedonobacterales bacterium]